MLWSVGYVLFRAQFSEGKYFSVGCYKGGDAEQYGYPMHLFYYYEYIFCCFIHVLKKIEAALRQENKPKYILSKTGSISVVNNFWKCSLF